MKLRHFMMFSASLFGCHFCMFCPSSIKIVLDRDFGGRSSDVSSATRSLLVYNKS